MNDTSDVNDTSDADDTSSADDTVTATGTPADTTPTASDTVIVILAAGAGSRFEGPSHKLMASLDGVPLATRVVETAVRSHVGPVVVVTGAVDPIGELPGTVAVHNPRWADGQATSLQAGIAAAAELGATAVVVGLADQPGVPVEAWRRVAASTAAIAVATYDGQRRNPVRLAAEIWPLLPTTGDEGARSVVRMRPDLVEPVPCPGSADDIDTLEDLESWQNRSSTNSR